MRLIACLVLVLTALQVGADEAGVRKYRDFTPQQLRDLPKEKLQAEVPIMYSMAAGRGLSNGSDLYFGMQLNALMYSGLDDYGRAVRAFQEDLRDKPTGVLTVWQIDQLEKRAGMQKLAPVSFPTNFSSFVMKDIASVEGTMIIVDERIAWPINHTKVVCLRSENTCELSKFYLVLPDDNSWTQTYQVMEDLSESYDISRWTENEIESHPLGTSSGCRNTSLSLNFKTKEFYLITRNAGGDCKLPLGGQLDKLPKPRVSQILDGEKVVSDKFSEIQTAAWNVLSSEFRRRAKVFEQPSENKQ